MCTCSYNIATCTQISAVALNQQFDSSPLSLLVLTCTYLLLHRNIVCIFRCCYMYNVLYHKQLNSTRESLACHSRVLAHAVHSRIAIALTTRNNVWFTTCSCKIKTTCSNWNEEKRARLSEWEGFVLILAMHKCLTRIARVCSYTANCTL